MFFSHRTCAHEKVNKNHSLGIRSVFKKMNLGFKESAVSRLHVYLKMRAFKALKTNKSLKLISTTHVTCYKPGSRALSRGQCLDVLPADTKVYNNSIV